MEYQRLLVTERNCVCETAILLILGIFYIRVTFIVFFALQNLLLLNIKFGIIKFFTQSLYYSRKQYSPLSPSSPEDSDSPPERINIDLMHELRDVIFPNTPPVDRTVSF